MSDYKNWKITSASWRNTTRACLLHWHNDKTEADDGRTLPGWREVVKFTDGTWHCWLCDASPPDEIVFCADIANCVRYQLPSKIYK